MHIFQVFLSNIEVSNFYPIQFNFSSHIFELPNNLSLFLQSDISLFKTVSSAIDFLIRNQHWPSLFIGSTTGGL